MFDLQDDDVISEDDLYAALKLFLTEFGISLNPTQLQHIVRETMRNAACSRNITFEKFKAGSLLSFHNTCFCIC